MGKFCLNFRLHSHYKRSGFKIQQDIENLKNTQNAQMIGLNSIQENFPILPPIFTGVKNNFALFYLLGTLVSEWSNKLKTKTFLITTMYGL